MLEISKFNPRSVHLNLTGILNSVIDGKVDSISNNSDIFSCLSGITCFASLWSSRFSVQQLLRSFSFDSMSHLEAHFSSNIYSLCLIFFPVFQGVRRLFVCFIRSAVSGQTTLRFLLRFGVILRGRVKSSCHSRGGWGLLILEGVQVQKISNSSALLVPNLESTRDSSDICITYGREVSRGLSQVQL